MKLRLKIQPFDFVNGNVIIHILITMSLTFGSILGL